MSSYAGRVFWGSGGLCTLSIDDLDSESWIGTPDPSMAILSSGQPFPWAVRVVLLDGGRAGEASNAELHCDPDASRAEFKGQQLFAPDPNEYESALRRSQLLDDLKAATDPDQKRAAFARLDRELWGREGPPRC